MLRGLSGDGRPALNEPAQRSLNMTYRVVAEYQDKRQLDCRIEDRKEAIEKYHKEAARHDCDYCVIAQYDGPHLVRRIGSVVKSSWHRA